MFQGNVVTGVRLEELSSRNAAEVLDITVFDHQLDFAPSISSSIELASKYDDASCKVICFGEEVCGFALYGIDDETGSWKIYRLIIDRQFQGKGIGKRALKKLLDILCDEHQAKEVLIVYTADNTIAHHLYGSCGFVPYRCRGDRVLAKLTLAGST